MEKKKQELVVSFPHDFKGGVYANNTIISHTKDEFIMDFIMLAPPKGIVTSRVITNPAQVKRLATALQDNISKYEEKFGKIEVAPFSHGQVGYGSQTKQ